MNKNILIPLREQDPFPSFLKEKHLVLEINRKEGEITTIYPFHVLPVEKIYFLGLGNGNQIKKTCMEFSRTIQEDVYVYVSEELSYEVSLGLYLGAYQYKNKTDRVFEFSNGQEKTQKAQQLSKCINFARYISDCPRNILTPIRFKDYALEIANQYALECEVYSNEELYQKGAHSILAVNAGSKYPAYIIKIKYNGNGNEPFTALIGKGLTFDSGGYSLKKNMTGMKYDMCGAANVLAIIEALAVFNAKVNCMAVLCITENMIGPDAYTVDDVISSMNGKTIEITNTDAEGRLALIDGFAIAQEENINRIIDMATLTGACANALGENYTGAFTNDESFLLELKEVCKQTKENIWQMPLDESFHKQIRKSKVADLTNAQVGKKAGASLAAAFLEEFVNENVSWIHLDIAATSNDENGATGVLIESIVKLLSV